MVPLDTHRFRIARRLRPTDRKTPGWKAALDLTRGLARLGPDDAVKYDFALGQRESSRAAPAPAPLPAGCACGCGGERSQPGGNGADQSLISRSSIREK